METSLETKYRDREQNSWKGVWHLFPCANAWTHISSQGKKVTYIIAKKIGPSRGIVAE